MSKYFFEPQSAAQSHAAHRIDAQIAHECIAGKHRAEGVITHADILYGRYIIALCQADRLSYREFLDRFVDPPKRRHALQCVRFARREDRHAELRLFGGAA